MTCITNLSLFRTIGVHTVDGSVTKYSKDGATWNSRIKGIIR